MKKVLIVVWNNFTNDKRVMNISSSLSNNNFAVSVIAAKEQRKVLLFEKKEYLVFRIPLFSSLYSKHSKNVSDSQKMSGSSFSFKTKIKNNRFRKMITAFLNWAGFNCGVFFRGLILKPDIIYANDLDTLTVCFLLSRILKTKLIFDSHELWLYGNKYENSTDLHKWWWRLIQRKLIFIVDRIIVTTKYRSDVIKKQYNLNKVYVIQNCPTYVNVKSCNFLRLEFNIPANNLIILYQGLLTRKRGIFSIVDVVENMNNVTTVFMGMGNDKLELKKYIDEKHLGESVFVKDAVVPAELLKYTSSADIGLQLLHNTDINHYSTISNKLFEYIMAGIAVIGSDFPEIRKIVTENEIGLLVDPKNTDEIRSAILKMVNDREFLESCKLNSKNNRHKYTWEEEEKKLLRIVRELY